MFAALPLAACHGQVPPTAYSVALTWTIPSVPAGSSWVGCGTGTPASLAYNVAVFFKKGLGMSRTTLLLTAIAASRTTTYSFLAR
jgi:hypothetical protein